MPEPLTIVIPMSPPSELFPNRRHRRGGLHPGIKAAEQCRLVAGSAARKVAARTPLTGPVELTIHAGYGYRRVTPDLDATISACKAFLDGVVDAGIMIDDSQVVRIVATHEKLKSNRKARADGFTALTFREAQAS